MMLALMIMVAAPARAAEAAGPGENLFLGKLRNVLASAGSAPPAGGAARVAITPPQDPDWLVPLGATLIALLALACLLLCVLSRWRTCGECAEGGPYKFSMFEHECLLASLGTVVLAVLSLATLYYYFCFRGGCYGGEMTTVSTAGAVAGRKAKMMPR